METLQTHYINAEVIHNWGTRYQDLPYFADLTPVVKNAIRHFYQTQHLLASPDCEDMARGLCERFPMELVYG